MSVLIERVPLPRIDFDAVRTANPLSSIVGALVKLSRAGPEMKGCCPFHPDRSPSFYVNDAKGFAHCFGCGWHGDVIDFTCQAYGVGVRDAVDMLGGGSMPVVPYRSITVQTLPEADRTDQAIAIWNAAVAPEGTSVEAYLRSRGLTLPIPTSIRFSRLPLGRRPIMPTLVALVTGADDRPCGIQRTYLTECGHKAALPDGKVKFSLGRVRGGAIRLGAASGDLIVCEGLEDGLTLAQEIGRPVWVSAGAGMLPSMRLPANVPVVIGADGDDAGEAAATKAAEAFSRDGRTVRIIRPSSGFKDFNAELTGVRS